ncbi:MAG: NADase-type glycan-binding domain-containing protein, partial [Mycobacterium sp.]
PVDAEPKPAVEFKPATGMKPTQGFKPAVESKPAVEPTPAVEPKPAVEPTPAVEPKSAAAEWKSAIEPKSAVEPKPAAAEWKPAIPKFGQRPASALVAPVPEGQPRAEPRVASQPDRDPAPRKPQPAEMRPQAPVRRRPVVPTTPSPPTRQPQPDDLICGACGEGNPPTRRFCSRCGESLQTATVTVVPTPWWRRILQLFDQPVRPAGARPKRRAQLLTLRGWMAMLRRVVIVALLLLALLYAVFPGMRSLVNGQVLALKDRVGSMFNPKLVQVRAISTEASAQLPDHTADMAADGFTNTFWEAPDAAAQPTLVLNFDNPTRLARAIVHNGGGEDYQALSRPDKLHLVYSAGEKIIGTSDVTLQDTPDQQTVDLSGGDGATRVEVHVMSVYRSLHSPALALSEIELYQHPASQ